jgi:hypothetical protein
MWTDRWERHWEFLQEQHIKVSGKEMNPTAAELEKLKVDSVPRSALRETNQDKLYYFLTLLTVLALTPCEAEHSISSLRRLKTYMRSTMSQDV